MKAKFVAALITGAAMLIAAPMWASVYDFTVCSNIVTSPPGPSSCPSSAPWDSGVSSLTYTNGIVAIGYNGTDAGSTSTTTHISIKTKGTDENGLGIVDDPNNFNQISSASTLWLNLSSLSFTSGDLVLESEQASEGAHICFSLTGTLGTFGNCLTQINPSAPPATVDVPINWSGTPFVSISGVLGHGDVLVNGLTTPTADEPSALLLLAITLGAGLLMLRKFNFRFEA